MVKEFPVRGGLLGRTVGQGAGGQRRVAHVDRGETLGVVGESGCGKSTLGRVLLRLLTATRGHGAARRRRHRRRSPNKELRRRAQMVFQDPYASLNPRMTIGEVLAEPFLVHQRPQAARAVTDEVGELLETVGPVARAPEPVPPRVLRGPAAAHRHRPGPGGRSRGDRARRAGLGARRVDPGRRRQPARRSSRTSGASPTCSSPTTCRWSATSRTGSR